MAARELEKAMANATSGGKGVTPALFASEIKKIIALVQKDPEAMPQPKIQYIDQPVMPIVKAVPHPVIQKNEPMVDLQPKFVPPNISVSNNGSIDFKWDSEACASNITLSDGNTVCYLMEGGYCFRTVLGNHEINGGIAYWEIHGDPRTENELKIGVVAKKNFNLNTAFCDYEYGWGYYGLGQLRHGNNSAGDKYGKPFKNSGVLGIFLDMIKGQLSFAVNGEYLGVAFKSDALKHGPMYPAVSLLHKAGCKLVTGKPVPNYFPH